MRTRVLLAAVLTAALGLGGCATTSTSAPTKVLVFAPSSGSGAATPPSVSATASGSCWEGSLALFRDASAWRCTAGNQIMDPCFAPPDQPDARRLVCVSSPWSPEIALTLTQSLPLDAANSSGTGPRPVWAVELANRDHCVVSSGTAPVVGTVVLDFTCDSGSVAGRLDRGHQPWTMEYRRGSSQALHVLAVRTAWD